MFILPYDEEEFEEKNLSGDYKTISTMYSPGDLVTHITTGPIFKPARLFSLAKDGKADIEYAEFDGNNSTKIISSTVGAKEYVPLQLAGPNITVVRNIPTPLSMANCSYDQEFYFYLGSEDLEPFWDAVGIMANRQFRNKLAHFRMNPVRPPVPKPVAPGSVIMGDLLITIVSLKNLKTNQGSGDVYVEVKSYEHGKGEDQFATFEFDDSPIKGTESYKRPTKMLNKTMPEPFDRNVYFNEEQNMGIFVKGETHEISFVVKQKTKSGDVAIGEVSIKSDDYLDPFRPAREVYLLFYDPPRFQSSLYLNVLFVPSNHTLDKMRITKPVPEDFDSAYHEWILSKNVYVDDYKFIVPIGTYSNLVDPEQIRVDEEDYEEQKEQKKYGVTPEKRLRNAIDSVPSLRDYNHQLREKNSLRPEYEDILYHFRQMQMYLNNEAKAKANQMRQEYCWNDFLMKVTENIHDNSVDPSGDVDEFGENASPKTRGHMFSVAGRSTWGKESWQNVDIQTLCRLGISPNLRNRVWYDLLEVSRIEEMTETNLVELPEYCRGLNTYENLKLIAVKYTNIAFAQIDEDMNTLNISNTPTVDDRGKIKNILKCFVLWQKICETSLCYSINFWFIIQRLLIFYTEERAFWVFVGIMDKMKNRIGIERSLMLDRKGMFRLCSACLSSHCKQMMPEIFSKFTEIGVSIDFFLYDQMSSLFSNWFPSDTLLRLWDLIFLDFSSPANGGVSKGLGYIISTSLYLLKVNEAQILISNTPEELSIALHNSCSTKFDTEEIISDIYDLNDRNFVAGNWFSRRLASVSKTFGDAASYLDNARISFEEDLDLVFEKTIRENRAVWDLLHPAGEEEPLDYLDWFGEESSILPKFKRKFSQIPSSEFSTAARGDSKNGNLKFRNVFIFVYSLFDNQTDINAKIGNIIVNNL